MLLTSRAQSDNAVLAFRFSTGGDRRGEYAGARVFKPGGAHAYARDLYVHLRERYRFVSDRRLVAPPDTEERLAGNDRLARAARVRGLIMPLDDSSLRGSLIHAFGKFRMSGNTLIPFVVRLSNHERNRINQRLVSEPSA